MSLQEVANKVFMGKDIKTQYIGFYEKDENGKPKQIIPDYADEILETHAGREITDYQYVEKHQCLVVKLKEEK